MCTVRPDLADYLLNYQDNLSNDIIPLELNSAVLCEESSPNVNNEENLPSDSDTLPKRQREETRTSKKKANNTAKLISTANKKRQNIRAKSEPKNKKVCQTMAGSNNLFTNESIIELLRYQESDQMNTTYSYHRNEGTGSSRSTEIERRSFDSGIHSNDEWNRTCLIPVNDDGMLDSYSDDSDSDGESFTDDQLALIDTVMSHDTTIHGNHREILPNDNSQHDMDTIVIPSDSSPSPAPLPENMNLSTQDSKQNSSKCIFDNGIQTSQSKNHESFSQELNSCENYSTIEDQEIHVNCSGDGQEIELAGSQQEQDQEKISVDSDHTLVDIAETNNCDSDDSITSPFTKLQSENAESTIIPEVDEQPNKIMQNNSDISTQGSEPAFNSKTDNIVLDSDCENKSIQSLDFDLCTCNEVITSTPIHSASTKSTINDTPVDSTTRFDECPPNKMSKHAIDYLMQMDEDNVDDAIEVMLSSQFPKLDAFSEVLLPTRLPLCPSHDSEQQINSSNQVEDMILETEVCAEVTVDNDIPSALEEDAPFLPPERRDENAVNQEELPSNLPKPSTNSFQLAQKNSKNKGVVQKNSKNKSKQKTPKIKESKVLKPKTDRNITQKRLKRKKCVVMTELKKQQLLSKYINNGKQMQLVIPFLPIKSKKKTNFKVMPRNTPLITKLIDKSTSIAQTISNSGKDTADIEPHKDTRIPASSTTSEAQPIATVENKGLEVPSDNDNPIQSAATSVDNEANSNDGEPVANAVKLNTNENSVCSSIADDNPSDSNNNNEMMCDESSPKTSNVDASTTTLGQDIESDESNTVRQQVQEISSRQTSPESIDVGFNDELSDSKQEQEVIKPPSDENCKKDMDLCRTLVQAKEQSEDNEFTQIETKPIVDSCQHALVGSCQETLMQEKQLQERTIDVSLGQSTSKATLDSSGTCTSAVSCKDTVLQEKEPQEESIDLSLVKVTDTANMDSVTCISADCCKDTLLQEKQPKSIELSLGTITAKATMNSDISAENYKDIPLQEGIKDDTEQNQHSVVGSCKDAVIHEKELQESIELSLVKITDSATMDSDTLAENYKEIPLQDTEQIQHAVVHEKEVQEELVIELSPRKISNVAAIDRDIPVEECKDISLQEETKDYNELVESTIAMTSDCSVSVNHFEKDHYEEKCVQMATEDMNTSGYSVVSSNGDMTVNGDNYERILSQENEHCKEQSMEVPSTTDDPEHGTMVLDNDGSEPATVDQCDHIQIQAKESPAKDDQFRQSTIPESSSVLVDSSENSLLHEKKRLEKESVQISTEDDVKSRKSNESIRSCASIDSCTDVLHQSDPLEISKEEKLVQGNTFHLNSTYLDVSCHENTNERKKSTRKRKAENLNNSSAANKGDNEVGAKKSKQRMKEKAIQYYKKKIKQLKKENKQCKDKSLLMDWVGDFRNEIKNLKKSIETLQKKTKEHESIIHKQESDLKRLGQEMSLLNSSSTSSGREPFAEERQDATITSSDNNEYQT